MTAIAVVESRYSDASAPRWSERAQGKQRDLRPPPPPARQSSPIFIDDDDDDRDSIGSYQSLDHQTFEPVSSAPSTVRPGEGSSKTASQNIVNAIPQPARPDNLPIEQSRADGNNDDEEELDSADEVQNYGPQAIGKLKGKIGYDETDGIYADEDPEDVLQNALAGIGSVLLQSYLTKWDGIMTEKAQAQAEKDRIAREAAAAANGGSKKKNKKKNKENGEDTSANSFLGSVSTPQAGPSRRPGPTPSRSARREQQRSHIDVDDDSVTIGDVVGSRKKQKTKKKATFTIDENDGPTETLYRFAQWLEFEAPVFEIKRVLEDRRRGIASGYSGQCTLNGQLFVSRAVCRTKAEARDDVATDVIEYFCEQHNNAD
ncbi:hypothetical protein OC845_000804 [Tilletia horrida]|nr:hypothetical protein OC845_000804 [Tilletia horrida]